MGAEEMRVYLDSPAAAAAEVVKKKGKVCVTGGAGFVASWLVKKLLEGGYSVRATVRSDPKFKEETGHLTSLPGASDNLEIFDADLTRPESFVPVVEGCVGVFHVATPTDFGAEDYDQKAARVAVEGVLGVLRACAASGTVRRVMYTSSASAVVFSGGANSVGKEQGGGTVVLDESVWTDEEFCRAQDVPIAAYFVSKTLAERAALDFGAEHGLDVVTVLPSSVVGPFLVPHFPTSYVTSLALLRGDREHCKLLRSMQFVHIDDVAAAHIFLFECPDVRPGRYLCSAADTTIRSLAGLLRTRFPEFHIPDELVGGEDGKDEEPTVRLSSEKLKGLGFEFRCGLEEMFEGAVHCCKQKGFL
ncbi:hypothetical protein Taro_041616 [Colocasia esculenta]|uniref:NAD-dependent epimerase/dehydratase domain-containing protein n=1 Tax=Colocasia esculenta TaxID=4460 RepID=A0A843X0W4_COLES|nr:hypothetical protein [Colocasia esculenta]